MPPLHAIAFILVIGTFIWLVLEQRHQLKTAKWERDQWKALVDQRANTPGSK